MEKNLPFHTWTIAKEALLLFFFVAELTNQSIL